MMQLKRLPDAVQTKAKIIELKADQVAADGTIEGYLSVFDNVDGGSDMVMPGAFRNTLLNPRRKQLPMLHEHRTDHVIGIWDKLVEDNYGLKAKGRIIDTELGVDTLKMMRAGFTYGLSIGYDCKRHEVDENVTDQWGYPIRKILECELWEGSVVVFPMNNDCDVTHVKAHEGRTSLAATTAELKRIVLPARPPLSGLIADLRNI